MQIKKNLTLDLNPKTKLQVVSVKQDDADTRVFIITITLDGETVSVPSSAAVRFRCIKPDGYGCLYRCDVNSDGTITLVLSAESTACPGLTLADISIDEDGVLSTTAFWLDVRPSGVSENIGGSNEYKELVETCEKAEALIEQLSGGVVITCTDDGNENITIDVVSTST